MASGFTLVVLVRSASAGKKGRGEMEKGSGFTLVAFIRIGARWREVPLGLPGPGLGYDFTLMALIRTGPKLR